MRPIQWVSYLHKPYGFKFPISNSFINLSAGHLQMLTVLAETALQDTVNSLFTPPFLLSKNKKAEGKSKKKGCVSPALANTSRKM